VENGSGERSRWESHLRQRKTHTYTHIMHLSGYIVCIILKRTTTCRRRWRLNRIRFTSHACKDIVYIYKGKNRLDYGQLPIRSSLPRPTNPQLTSSHPPPPGESTFRWLDDDCRPSSSYHSTAAHLFTIAGSGCLDIYTLYNLPKSPNTHHYHGQKLSSKPLYIHCAYVVVTTAPGTFEHFNFPVLMSLRIFIFYKYIIDYSL